MSYFVCVLIYLVYMYGCFTCMCVCACTMRVFDAQEVQKGMLDSPGAAIWVLRTKPWSSERGFSALNC